MDDELYTSEDIEDGIRGYFGGEGNLLQELFIEDLDNLVTVLMFYVKVARDIREREDECTHCSA